MHTKLLQSHLDERYEKFIASNEEFKNFLFHHDISDLSLEGKDLSNAYINHTKLINTNLSNCNLYKAEILWCDLTNTNLNGSNLCKARISGTKINMSILDHTFKNDIEFHANKKCSLDLTIEPSAEFFKSNVSMFGHWNNDDIQIIIRVDYPDDRREFYYKGYFSQSECKFEFKSMKKLLKCIPSDVKVWEVISAYMRSSSKRWEKVEEL